MPPPPIHLMQPTASYLRAPRTPTAPGFRRILNDIVEDHNPADAKYAACHGYSMLQHQQQLHHQQQQQQQHIYHQHQQSRPIAAEIPLRQHIHDLPRPQLHNMNAHFQSSQPHILPPLTVSSISPPNSSRPLLGLAPLRAANRRCRLLNCVNPAKLQGLCPEHLEQQQQIHADASPVSPYYQQQQQIHETAYMRSPVNHSAGSAPRPTLPPVRCEFSIPSMLSASPPRQRSPYTESHHYHHHHPYSCSSSSSSHHHQYRHRRTPVLPALRTVGLPLDDHVVSPAASSAAPSPTSSTSSYSSYGHGSESANVRTPPASAATTPLSATSSASRASSASGKPAAKCRREHCLNAARRKGLCMEHGGRHFCKMDGCSKCAHRGGFCISHGGGRRCAVANCTKSAQSGGICYSHGGGKRCATDGCSHAARSGGFCIKHGKQQSQSVASSGDSELEQ